MNKARIMRGTCVILLLALALASQPSEVDATQGAQPLEKTDPLLWAPLVLRGEITRVSEESSTLAEWGVVARGPQEVVVESIELLVDEVIKGSWKDRHVRVSAFKHLHGGDPAPYSVGNQVVVAVYYNPTVQKLQLRNYLGLFVRQGDDWVRPVIQGYPIPGKDASMRIADISSRVNSMSVDAVADQADVVVIGKLISAESAAQHERYESRCWDLEVSEVVKGEHPEKHLRFCMPTRGALPEWAVPVPRNLKEGASLLVFLRRHDDRLIPFAGVNGMLTIDGGRLLYDGAIELGAPLSEITSVRVRQD